MTTERTPAEMAEMIRDLVPLVAAHHNLLRDTWRVMFSEMADDTRNPEDVQADLDDLFDRYRALCALMEQQALRHALPTGDAH